MTPVGTRARTADPAQEERIAAYRDARRRATRWLLAQLNPDGSMGDPVAGYHIYRAPWAFTVVGETEAALATSAWLRRNLLGPDGRIGGPYRVSDWWATYRDATLMVGATLAMQYDLAHGVWRGLQALRDPGSGLYGVDAPVGGAREDIIDLTAGGPGTGFAALAVGDLDAAHGIAGALRRIRDLQAGAPGRFHFAWSASRGELVREPDPRWDAPVMVLDTRLDAPQYWFLGGISAAFLGRLWLADPDPGLLELARWYQALAMDATDAQFRYPAACKGSWGASLLWQITGEERYRDFLLKLGDWYVAGQEPDGWWHPLGGDYPDGMIEITLEFVMHLDTLIGALAAR